MLSILAPSKTMDFSTPLPFEVEATQPLFLTHSEILHKKVTQLSRSDLMKLMHISKDLAERTHELYQHKTVMRPALWAYVGDVYKGLRARDFTQQEANWAQKHLLISSGLYGLIRPYDNIQGYRLEMSAKLKVGKSKNLYEFWSNDLSNYIISTNETLVCNLSSNEYARPILSHLPNTIRVITPVFIDRKESGREGPIPIYSKIMRGVMAHWIIKNQINSAHDLEKFAEQGYTFDVARSKPDFPAFYRHHIALLRF